MLNNYLYQGATTSKCPVCKKRIGMIGPPVIYISSGNKVAEHRWCLACFNLAHEAMASAPTEGRIEQELLPFLQQLAQKALPQKVSNERIIMGFQFSVIPNQGLTLVIELGSA